MSSEITDVWFRTALPLEGVAEVLGLSDVSRDAENYWEWVIGILGDTALDITRTHKLPPGSTDTRIFRVGRGAFDKQQLDEIASRLRSVAVGPIRCGDWALRSDSRNVTEI